MDPIWLKPIKQWNKFKKTYEILNINKGSVLINGMGESQKCHMVSGLINPVDNRKYLYLTYNDMQAVRIYEDMSFFYPDRVRLFPSREILLYNVAARSRDIMSRRIGILEELRENDSLIVVASIESLIISLMSFEEFKNSSISLKVGQCIPINELSKRVVNIGYERVDNVEGNGQFSIRGGIFDIFPLTSDQPYRIEFFDEEIDSIRDFDPVSQRSQNKLDDIYISPGQEWMKNEECIHESSIIDYLGLEPLIIVDEPERIREHYRVIQREFEEHFKDAFEKGHVTSKQYHMILDYDKLVSKMNNTSLIILQALPREHMGFDVDCTLNVTSRTVAPYHGMRDLLIEDIGRWKDKGYYIILMTGNRPRGEGLINSLKDAGFDPLYYKDSSGEIEPGQIIVIPGTIEEGFEYPDATFVMVSDREIYGIQKRKPRRSKHTNKLETFTDLKPGDYVVHENHGIGKYVGIETLLVNGQKKDYLHVQYGGSDKLYIPTDQMDIIQPYIGMDERTPRLSKLGGAEWQRAKTRVRQSIEALADDLLKLYASREAAKGHAFSRDTQWQKQFEDLFPYEETPDQLQAVEEIKKDMESSKVMDRLLCGDVGYGKTEVAIRAAFKAAVEGKQVAVLAPTTILAQQHYNTFKGRFSEFPLTVEVISRFKTPREQKNILKSLKEGNVDIIIGTHRLLGKDVIFKDLGLLVVDEEQRFGVSHKEKIKSMKSNVDVLTLTATPIPRTLHMAMVGIRDISVIETPPEERYPVQTYVVEFDEMLVRDAIMREVSRGGQVYFVYNSVKTMDRMAQRLRNLVPEVKVGVAHGQMGEVLLEKTMLDFQDGEFDILLCSTIIESGLDIPNVNTLIVYDADRFGLSQLYQLKGRVGRANRMAYAYFTYRKDKVLSEVAEKRLKAIKEFTEFGSGFKIAMRDLEIRGAGNILGAEQHGHMASVGYDMYCKLLSETLSSMKGDIQEQIIEPLVDIRVDAHIDSSYIPSEGHKIEIYKKIASIDGIHDKLDVEDEIIDRFGDYPEAVENLINIAYAKSLAKHNFVTEINHKGREVRLKILHNKAFDPRAIMILLNENMDNLKFVSSTSPYFELKIKDSLAKTALEESIKILEKIRDLQHKVKEGIMS